MILPVKLDDRRYNIFLESGNLYKAGQLLPLNRKVLIVTDDGVPENYAAVVAAQCRESIVVTIPHGEGSKSMEQFRKLLSALLNASFKRSDCVVAVGGGVVGDLSGFTASCYMRGVDFYNIPTTLLSQVDSSIGGKTAIDFEGVKNMVGTFYQPKSVIIDPAVLETLEKRQLHSGLAEAIKMAATCDSDLFEMIEQSENLCCDLPGIIKRALCIKRDVVEKDPTETGLRRVLNFGHTIGHALESYYNGELLHGECVALGMLAMCSEQVRERLIKVLKKYSLPTETEPQAKELLPYLLHDKKMQSESIKTVFVDEMGTYKFLNMHPEEILNLLEKRL